MGLGSAGATLAARYHLPIVGDLWLTNAPDPSGFLYWQIPPDMDTPYILFVGSKNPGFDFFPYGYPVDPDVRL
jgi:hypothetical protein